jgi:phage shock protein C
MNRRLYRCSHDRRIAGVAAGVAEYLDIDVTLVRVLWVVSIFFGGFGLLLYLVMAFVMPLEPVMWWPANAPDGAAAGAPTAGGASWPHRHATAGTTSGSGLGMTVVGAALILFGALALLDQLVPAWPDGGRVLWPAFILGLGVILMVTAVRRRQDAS